MFTIDAHLDLAMNAMEWNRDLRCSVDDIRKREKYLTDKPDRAKGTVAFPELRKGNIGLVVATQIARYVSKENSLPGWHSPQQAWAQTQAQLAWYKAMEAEGEMVMIKDASSLRKHIDLWKNDGDNLNDGNGITDEYSGSKKNSKHIINDKKPIGYILSLEGADSLVNIDYLHTAYEYGLRAVGPAHYGPGRYANGTDATGHLNDEGKALLKEMQSLNIILDATHLCDDAFWDAMELFNGYVWASHNNCRALVNYNRQFSDEMIKALIEKGAVIGCALDAWMMVPGWQREVSDPVQMNCNLEKMIDHIDHICQLAGNTKHVGIGTDLDGAFGKEQCPSDLETIADLNKLPSMFAKRGYGEDDTANFMHRNWLRFLLNAWKNI